MMPLFRSCLRVAATIASAAALVTSAPLSAQSRAGSVDRADGAAAAAGATRSARQTGADKTEPAESIRAKGRHAEDPQPHTPPPATGLSLAGEPVRRPTAKATPIADDHIERTAPPPARTSAPRLATDRELDAVMQRISERMAGRPVARPGAGAPMPKSERPSPSPGAAGRRAAPAPQPKTLPRVRLSWRPTVVWPASLLAHNPGSDAPAPAAAPATTADAARATTADHVE